MSTALYETVRKDGHDTKDCAVIAVSIATDTDYDVVHKMMKKNGRKDGKGTPYDIIMKTLAELGYTTNALREDSYTWGRRRYKKVKRVLRTVVGRSYEVLKFVNADTIGQMNDHKLPEGTFLVQTYSHILAVKDGKVHDWTNGRRHRPFRILELVKLYD